ncbi:956_t:CDS:2 [Dentiscutata erythropus]|uniref:956_t:CDS:1 n=1 Tax=Dentiscutata erythropus TaxID=1348616 RepID=A0A9N8W1I9_9GLOM|nr:956_t:CDS:2 [Dentiscutata erythropus]
MYQESSFQHLNNHDTANNTNDVNTDNITDLSVSQNSIFPSDSTIENTDDFHFRDDDDDSSNDAELEPFGYELKFEIQSQTLQIRATDQEKISEDDVAIINSIMKNIKIPDSAVPEWAKVIPEEAWLPVILNNNETSEETNSNDIS